MGARSPPEGDRVAAGRYGLPVRSRGTRGASVFVLAPVVPAMVLLAACGTTGSKASGGGHTSPCAYVAKLDDIADGIARADVHDPDAFKKTLDTAVRDYVDNVKSLRAVAPSALSASLDRVESDVEQYRFVDARTDRADLDAYAARTCGRALLGAPTTCGPPTTGSSIPGSSIPGSVPDSSTTVPSIPETSTNAVNTASTGLSSGG